MIVKMSKTDQCFPKMMLNLEFQLIRPLISLLRRSIKRMKKEERLYNKNVKLKIHTYS